jgi:hypothetical protein
VVRMDSRHAAAAMLGLVDAAEHLGDVDAIEVLEMGADWPAPAVRLAALKLLAARGRRWLLWAACRRGCRTEVGVRLVRDRAVRERGGDVSGVLWTTGQRDSRSMRDYVYLDTGSYVDPSAQTVEHYLREEWLPARRPTNQSGARGHRGQVSLATWTTLRDQVEAYVVPYIGAVRLQDVTIETLDSLYDELEESGGRRGQGLPPQTVHDAS